MDTTPISPQPGSTIDPASAVRRRDVLRRAREEFTAGNNLSLTDPRRMGKTVLLDLLVDDPGAGLLAIKIDYEGVRSSTEFVLRTLEGLRAHRGLASRTRDRWRTFFDNVDLDLGLGPVKLGVAATGRSATALLSDVILAVEEHLPPEALLVVAMDEVPIAIANIKDNEGPAAAHQLLQCLRELRRRRSRLRWILCGSIGFHHVLRACGATEGVINDLVNLPLGPMTQPEAVELAHRLLLGIGHTPTDPAVSEMVRVTERIPFLLHALAHRLRESGLATDATRVVSVFDEFVGDREDSRALTHLVTRLDPLYEGRVREAELLLDRVATAGSVPTADVLTQGSDQIRLILDDLVDDHYLVEGADAIRWRYDVLRRVWHRRRRLSS
ncbi:hypothetical protein [Nocardioides plantarum]|uniref:Orc1-like AAA ATPase domain-containing protein n=1 Tax=Nocardioides plantarum TaxID=29299 RepID=A0ABV5KC69_9ACTN|nr:hypothetical protein [Nocardioides plantarum]